MFKRRLDVSLFRECDEHSEHSFHWQRVITRDLRHSSDRIAQGFVYFIEADFVWEALHRHPIGNEQIRLVLKFLFIRKERLLPVEQSGCRNGIKSLDAVFFEYLENLSERSGMIISCRDYGAIADSGGKFVIGHVINLYRYDESSISELFSHGVSPVELRPRSFLLRFAGGA